MIQSYVYGAVVVAFVFAIMSFSKITDLLTLYKKNEILKRRERLFEERKKQRKRITADKTDNTVHSCKKPPEANPQVEPPAEEYPALETAIRHRCVKSRKRKTLRVYVSDFADGTSRAIAKVSGSAAARYELGAGIHSDADWLRLADTAIDNGCVAETLSGKTTLRRPPDFASYIRTSELGFHNQWIWQAGAFDALFNKRALLSANSRCLPRAA